ncbi:MAG: hypothetical protein IIY11_08125 [Clostridia bacterium]|nr:hypothetical protein [Clostridia bacterium]
MQLDRRKMKILSAIIGEYIRTGEPVGSKRVAQMMDTQVSSATCRNEMSHLFGLGLLEQPHTSAGRIPSHLAFRIYLDELLAPQMLTDAERTASTPCSTSITPTPTAFWPMRQRPLPDTPAAWWCLPPVPPDR